MVTSMSSLSQICAKIHEKSKKSTNQRMRIGPQVDGPSTDDIPEIRHVRCQHAPPDTVYVAAYDEMKLEKYTAWTMHILFPSHAMSCPIVVNNRKLALIQRMTDLLEASSDVIVGSE